MLTVDAQLTEASQRITQCKQLREKLTTVKDLSAAQGLVSQIKSTLYSDTSTDHQVWKAYEIARIYQKYGTLLSSHEEVIQKEPELRKLKENAEQRWATEWLPSHPETFARALERSGWGAWQHDEPHLIPSDIVPIESILPYIIGPHYKVVTHDQSATQEWQPPTYEPDGILALSTNPTTRWLIRSKGSDAESAGSESKSDALRKCAE